LVDSNETVRDAVKSALDELGASALPALETVLKSTNGVLVKRALTWAIGLGKAAVGPLEQCLDSQSVLVRSGAVDGLGMLGEEFAKQTLPLIEAAAGDENEDVRAAAARALKRAYGAVPPPVVLEPTTLPGESFDSASLDEKTAKSVAKSADVGQLKTYLFDGRTQVRENAAIVLGQSGKAALDVLPSMLLALKDSEPTVKVAVASALGELGHEPERVVPSLIEGLLDAPEPVEEAILSAIKSYGKKAVEPALTLLPYRLDWVAKTLGKVVVTFPELFAAALGKVVNSDAPQNARYSAAEVLRLSQDDGAPAEADLLAALQDVDPILRIRAVKALGRVAKPTTKLREKLKEMRSQEPKYSVQEAYDEALQYLSARAKAS
ncbi:MAG: HEAT repeat domain-containing protein, partial [Myxococcales bacterium]|nr:HEAT repeat domain-containing protein [Myxococcales bacterium]